ncbi:hypothetical protein D3C73_1432960 [compost metagenome]
MGTHDRVDDFGDLGELLRGQGRAPVAFEFGLAVTRGVGVRCRAPFNGVAQCKRQVVPGFVHIGEQCVTAF